MPTPEERVLAILNRDHLTQTDEAEVLALGNEAIQVLLRWAQGQYPEGRPDLRSRAIVVLGSSTDPAHTQLLGQLLASLEEVDRIRAMIALGRQGTDAALGHIASYASRPSATEAEFVHAARAIGASGNPQAGSMIAQLRTSRPLSETMVAALDNISNNTPIV